MQKNTQPARHEQVSAPADNRHYHQPVAPHGSDLAGGILSAGLILLLLIMLIVGLIEARQAVATASIILAYIMMVAAPIGAGALLYLRLKHKHSLDAIKIQHAAIDLEAKAGQVRREQETHEMRLHLAQTRLNPDALGNRPYVYDPRTSSIIEATSGNYLAPVPQHWAPSNRYDYKDTSTQVSEEKQKQLGPGAQQPTQDWILSQLPQNQLIVSPGVRSEDGTLVTVSIEDVPHFKILGASGFGKSCLAGSIIDQATQLNTPELFQLACLDLEHKTSRLFENLPHIATCRVGNRLVQMVASNADEVVEHLGYLKKLLDYRAGLSEQELMKQPVLFMYIEEMLSLQFEVDPALLKVMFAAITVLSVRGRKYGMFLLGCMQTDYSTDELKISQKMFRFRAAAAIDRTAATAAGFQNTELIKANFASAVKGTFVVEFPSFSSTVLAPIYDVKRLIGQKTGTRETAVSSFRDSSEGANLRIVNGTRTVGTRSQNDATNGSERPQEANIAEVSRLRALGWGKEATIKKVWNVTKGSSPRYKAAEMEYHQIIDSIEAEESEEAE